ncbi:hypothetical protein SUNI508_02933 [Seiridium unicorne]|uniref:Uncharacterized protein n=1 Tax=Seiridium unicorne TaxID=138068 RepID=A0ABR2VF76_9PEZI
MPGFALESLKWALAHLSSISSTLTTGPRSGTEQVLRKRYKDPVKLREGLDQLLGKGQYSLKLRNNRYIICGQKLLDKAL